MTVERLDVVVRVARGPISGRIARGPTARRRAPQPTVERATRPLPGVFFHGGTGGLEVGDVLSTPLARGSIIWFTDNSDVARAYTLHQGRPIGDVYRVEPCGPVRDAGAGRFTAAAASIVEVVERR